MLLLLLLPLRDIACHVHIRHSPTFLRAVPDKDKLASFLSTVKTLDVAVVASLLDERLSMGLPGGDAVGTNCMHVHYPFVTPPNFSYFFAHCRHQHCTEDTRCH